MKRYVIGDIHGRYKALKEVLKKSNFNYDTDKLIVLGDVVDGGVNTYEVVEELLKIKNLIYILGNHDVFLLIILSQGGQMKFGYSKVGVIHYVHMVERLKKLIILQTKVK